jgi:hypothetical protein
MWTPTMLSSADLKEFSTGEKKLPTFKFRRGHHGRESATLCKEGYQFKTANNVYAGLDFFRAKHMCVAIVDIKMFIRY